MTELDREDLDMVLARSYDRGYEDGLKTANNLMLQLQDMRDRYDHLLKEISSGRAFMPPPSIIMVKDGYLAELREYRDLLKFQYDNKVVVYYGINGEWSCLWFSPEGNRRIFGDSPMDLLRKAKAKHKELSV